MSVDPKGDAIRTWELVVQSPSISSYPFHIGYFSLKAAERSDGLYVKIPPQTSYPGKLYPEHPYAGLSDGQISAYGYINGLYPEIVGVSVDMDQARAEIPPGVDPPTPGIPSAPAMPEAKCGVAMQQYQETFTPSPIPPEPYLSPTESYASTSVLVYQNLTYDPVTETWYQDLAATPRIFYAFLLFNHPLYFRRSHTITFRISTYNYTGGYTIPGNPPIVVDPTAEGFYSSSTQTVNPTDNNYFTTTANYGPFIQPSNAIATYTLPDNQTTSGPYGSVDGTNYELVEVFISDVESND